MLAIVRLEKTKEKRRRNQPGWVNLAAAKLAAV
jgi:hypothetical protein